MTEHFKSSSNADFKADFKLTLYKNLTVLFLCIHLHVLKSVLTVDS